MNNTVNRNLSQYLKSTVFFSSLRKTEFGQKLCYVSSLQMCYYTSFGFDEYVLVSLCNATTSIIWVGGLFFCCLIA